MTIFEKDSQITDLTRPARDYWWWPHRSPQSTRPTILFFGGAGTDYITKIVHVLHPLIKNANFGVWRMPGRGDRSQEPDPSDIRKLAQEIASVVLGLRLPRPILVGYSFGGLLAYLVCQELERSDFQVGRFVPVASVDPLKWRLISMYTLMHGGRDAYLRRGARKYDGAGIEPANAISDPDLLAEARERGIADFRLGLQYVRHTRLATPITDVSASDDELIRFNNPLRWKRFTTGEFESIVIAGDHFFYQHAPEKLARVLSNVADHAYNSY